jgi:cation diffusion facilitator family transporter
VAGGSTRVVVAALLANAGIAIVKGIAAAVTGSGAMLAETIHSIADSGNQALLLLGAKRSRRPPDRKHPFGYGSERYFWAFVVAVVLFLLGAMFSLYEGIHKVMHPTPLKSVAWAYAVLLIGIVLEGASFLVARREVEKVRGARRFMEYFYESKAPALPLVYMEDFGALLGLTFALLGVASSDLLGFHYGDGLATIAVGLLLFVIAVLLLVRLHRLLVGEGASEADLRRIREVAEKVEGVDELVDLRTLHIGPETLLVVVDARFHGGAETAKAIERAIVEQVPHAQYVAVEPQTGADDRSKKTE